jgi:Ca2+-binding RTX toxin-like protein
VNGSNIAGDNLTGNGFANYLAGFRGDDTHESQGGNDFLYGGEGTDTFKFTNLDFGQD